MCIRDRPWGDTDQADFLNAAAQLSVRLDPAQLLRLAKKLEREQKREKTRRWGPRTLDIDLLVWPGRALKTPALTLPHPRIAERAFVLVPLADIAPDLELDSGSVGALAGAIDSSGIDRIAQQGRWWQPGECA
jgi:2-amino-4-hydroxy-6-hydroxymethyldihydropteridine diphosphokinase